ncbi:brachyurin-like [Trichoplusia ni]|uniref:Brachyurin-like n=1 Tax=Trichoplusia ni TaxID=7111 RepID=A0A7E5VHB7_TRINI|nr:brachyurin-like [Trichoplusia ni]
MKGFAFVLLCALVAVQGRSTAVQSASRELATLGENPYVVHLRLAVSTSGLLKTCAASVISPSWVLTAASCLEDNRYVWIRFGAVNVANPTLVFEAGNAGVRVLNNLGLYTANNRAVDFSQAATIAPVALSEAGVSDSGKLCVFGANSEGGPGELLSCATVGLEAQEDGSVIISSDDVSATEFDLGAAIVSDGVQVGVVTGAGSDDNAGVATSVEDYLSWIQETTGVNSNSLAMPEVAPSAVKFVN